MLPVIGLASGTILLLSRGDDEPPLPSTVGTDSFSHHEDGIEVPLALTRKQWLSFLHAAACGKPSTITPNFRFGVFGLTVRRLCDLGVMREPKVIKFKGRQVWDANWVNPSSLEAFQTAPMLQYRLFTDSIKSFFVSEEVSKAIGQFVDGERVTQSGALMVAHRAGLPGLVSWLADPEIRKRFSDNTTAFFEKANGIF